MSHLSCYPRDEIIWLKATANGKLSQMSKKGEKKDFYEWNWKFWHDILIVALANVTSDFASINLK